MPYIEKRIQSGKLLEIEKYFATRNGRPIPRSSNRAATPEDMRRVNQRNAEKRLMRLINTNFSRAEGDVFVTFTHAAGMDEAQAMREERNLMARLGRLRQHKGLGRLKYICVTEKQGRWHHHVLMNGGLTLEELNAVWGGRGRICTSLLDETYTYEDLAKYLTKQHKPRKGGTDGENARRERRKGQRRWHASRNLKEPVETKRVVKRPPRGGEPRPPMGYRLLPNWYVGCDIFGNLYTYAAFVMEKADKRRVRTARAAARSAAEAAAQPPPERKAGQDAGKGRPKDRRGTQGRGKVSGPGAGALGTNERDTGR